MHQVLLAMGSSPTKLARYAAILLALTSLTASADPDISTRFSGFASLGLVTSDNDDLVFRRDVTQKNGSYNGDVDWRADSLLGLQWQTQWSYQLETTAQFVLKDRVENNVEQALEWGFLRYRPIESLDIRLGRMGSDIFMLSDYRQVGYALPWVRPPHDTYGLFSFHHFDGVDILKRLDLGDSTINIKGFYGRLNQKYPLELDAARIYKLVFRGGGGSISWERNEWKARYSYADVDVLNNNASALIDALQAVEPYWPDANRLADSFYTKSRQLTYHQLGLMYDNNQWWAQAELSRLNSEARVISGTRHFYVSGGYRFNTFTLYGIKGYVRSASDLINVDAPSGYPEPLNQQLNFLANTVESTLNGSRSDQRSTTLGVRWDYTSKRALKFQVERFEVDKYGNALWLRADKTAAPKDETIHVVSLSWDLLF